MIGTTYGTGTGGATFSLPDLRGRVPMGFSLTTPQHPLASKGGQETIALTVANLAAHNHSAKFLPTTGPQDVKIPATPGTLSVTVNATDNITLSAPSSSTQLGGGKFYSTAGTSQVPLKGVSISGNSGSDAKTVSVDVVTGGTVTLDNTGAGTPVSTMMPYLALNFSIAMTGIYPAHS